MNKRRIRPQYNIVIIVVLAIINLMLSIHLLRITGNHGHYNFIFWLQLLAFILQIIFFGLLIINYLRMKPKRIQYGDESILVFQHDIPIVSIEKVMIRGYFFQTVGILPKNKKRAPSSFCFKFTGDQEEGILELIEWANAHHITVSRQDFNTWI